MAWGSTLIEHDRDRNALREVSPFFFEQNLPEPFILESLETFKRTQSSLTLVVLRIGKYVKSTCVLTIITLHCPSKANIPV